MACLADGRASIEPPARRSADVSVRNPDLRAEWRLWQAGHRLVVGVDEVGMARSAHPSSRPRSWCGRKPARSPGCVTPRRCRSGSARRSSPRIQRRSLAWGVGAASVARDRAAQHLPRVAPGDAPRAAPHRRPTTTSSSTAARSVGFEEHVGPYTLDHRRRRVLVCHRLRLDRGQGDARPADAAAGGALPGLRLGAQRRVRDARPRRRPADPRPHAVPSPHLSAIRPVLEGEQLAMDLDDAADRAGVSRAPTCSTPASPGPTCSCPTRSLPSCRLPSAGTSA